MRKNYAQAGVTGEDHRIHIDNDWYALGLPGNVILGESVYIDTSYGFAGFHSEEEDALVIGEASGCYDRSSLITGRSGRITVGSYTILNGTTLLCSQSITIGSHCMLAWGSVVMDSWMDPGRLTLGARREILAKTAAQPHRPFPFAGKARPVVLEDNCWVGFDAVIMPGVRLGRGCVIGCKSVVDFDVPPYAVVTGNPAAIIRYLPQND
jgi:maltose O-acetyltransferase